MPLATIELMDTRGYMAFADGMRCLASSNDARHLQKLQYHSLCCLGSQAADLMQVYFMSCMVAFASGTDSACPCA